MLVPKVTVLMSVYNGEKYLREAIDSILHQTYTNFEFLIIDDASTDTTPEILHQYSDPRIRLVKNENNLGLTKSLNKGLALANGEYIARMDADDICMPERFEKQLNYFDRNPETDVLGTGFKIFNANDECTGEKFFPEKVTTSDFSQENQLIHGSVMVKKSVIIDVGGYNEYFQYVQDYELWLRVSKKYQIRNIPAILYKLRYHGDNIAFTKKEKSAQYHILAKKLASGEISNEIFHNLDVVDMKKLIHIMNKNDLIFFHNSKADMYIFQGNIPLARNEYRENFYLNPFDLVNIIRFLRTFLGKKGIQITSQFIQKMNFHSKSKKMLM